MQFENKKILILGYGKTGKAVAKFLTTKNSEITVFDNTLKEDIPYHYINSYNGETFDLCVISPGISVYSDIVTNLQQNNIQIISEIELAYMFCKGKIIAITGTNGKTTTVSLLSKILEEAGKKVFLCGNIGTPFISLVNEIKEDDYVVLEVSSFQLEAVHNFKPNIAAILNIKYDHIDRHKTFENYRHEKCKIFKNMDRGLVVLNNELNDIFIPKFCDIERFSSSETCSAYLSKSFLYYKGKKFISISKINLLGKKNYENVLCAIIIANYLNIKKRHICKAIKKFKPDPHRLEIVLIKKGVMYVDDSKATNVDSTLCAIDCFTNIILLVGGKAKGYEYDEVTKSDKVKYIVSFGEVREKVKDAALRQGRQVFQAVNLYQATVIASKLASKGDVVLLSPASASFDEFTSYKERGEKFKEFVSSL